MHTHLAQLIAALEQRNQPLQLFLRDDDVAQDETSLRQLLDLCLRYAMPVNLAVIPGKLTTDGAALLNQSVARFSSSIELHQHGWLHLNHETSGKKCEFGASRTAEEQCADLAAGRARMNEAFGAHWFPVFVPPWNRCTETTARLLTQLGFRALSRDAGQPPLSLREMSVTIDLHAWHGGAQLRPLDEFTNELVRQIQHADRIGLLVHHQVMDGTAFAWLEALLQTFADFPLVECCTLQSLLTDERTTDQTS
jgi:predicted deacetylase